MYLANLYPILRVDASGYACRRIRLHVQTHRAMRADASGNACGRVRLHVRSRQTCLKFVKRKRGERVNTTSSPQDKNLKGLYEIYMK